MHRLHRDIGDACNFHTSQQRNLMPAAPNQPHNMNACVRAARLCHRLRLCVRKRRVRACATCAGCAATASLTPMSCACGCVDSSSRLTTTCAGMALRLDLALKRNTTLTALWSVGACRAAIAPNTPATVQIASRHVGCTLM